MSENEKAESKHLSVYKSDLKKIGGTVHGDDAGKTCFICNVETSNIEEILLREILVLYGYKINNSVDFVWESDQIDIEFQTDMPWKEYMALD